MHPCRTTPSPPCPAVWPLRPLKFSFLPPLIRTSYQDSWNSMTAHQTAQSTYSLAPYLAKHSSTFARFPFVSWSVFSILRNLAMSILIEAKHSAKSWLWLLINFLKNLTLPHGKMTCSRFFLLPAILNIHFCARKYTGLVGFAGS